MAHEPVALTTSVESAPPSGADYDAICAAVMETVRGRWFLQEYARRNRNADTSTVLNAIERLEAAIQGERTGQVVERFRFDLNEMAEAVALAKAEIAAIKPDDAVAGNGRPGNAAAQVHDRATSDLLATAEQIQDLSWRLREQGVDAQMCDGLDARAREIIAACSQPDLTGQRTHSAIEMLRSLEGRLNDLMSFSAQKPTSTTHAFPVEAPGNGAHPKTTELILEPLIPATAVVVHRTEHDPVRNAAVVIDHEPLVPARPSLHVEAIAERAPAPSEPPVERERVPTVSTLLATPTPLSARPASEDGQVPTVALLESKMADLLASMSAPSSRPVIALNLAQRLAEASPLVVLRELEIARTTVVVTREPPPPKPEATSAPAVNDQEDPAAFLFEPLSLPTTRSVAAPAALQLDPEPLRVAQAATRSSEPEPEPVIVLEPVPFRETVAAVEPAEEIKPAALMLEPIAQAEATRSISSTAPEPPPPSGPIVSVATPEPEPLVLASEADKVVAEVEVTHAVTASVVVEPLPEATTTDVLAPVATRSPAEPLGDVPVVAQVEQPPEAHHALVIVTDAPEPAPEAASTTVQQFEGQFVEIFQAAPARPPAEHSGEVSLHPGSVVESEPLAISQAPPEPEPIEAVALRSLTPREPETAPPPESAAVEALAEPTPPVVVHAEHSEPRSEPVLVGEAETLVVEAKEEIEVATPPPPPDPIAELPPEHLVARSFAHEPEPEPKPFEPLPPVAHAETQPEPPEPVLVLEPEPLVVASKPEVEHPIAPTRSFDPIPAREPEPPQPLSHDPPILAGGPLLKPEPPPVDVPNEPKPMSIAQPQAAAEMTQIVPVVVEATPTATAPEIAVAPEPVVVAELAPEPAAPAPEPPPPAPEPPVAPPVPPSALAGTPLPDAAPITPTAFGAARLDGKTNGAHPPVAQPRLARPTPRPAPHDPLAPLALMSDEEKIALFS